MEAIKLCRLDTPIIFIEARINLSRFVVTGDRKSGSAGMPRPISYAVFCLKKKNNMMEIPPCADDTHDVEVHAIHQHARHMAQDCRSVHDARPPARVVPSVR